MSKNNSGQRGRASSPRALQNRWEDWEARVCANYFKTGSASETAKNLGLHAGTVARWVRKYGLDEERRKQQRGSADAYEGLLKLLSMEVENLVTRINKGDMESSATAIDSIKKLSSTMKELKKDAQVVQSAQKGFDVLLEVIAESDQELVITILERYMPATLERLEDKFG